MKIILSVLVVVGGSLMMVIVWLWLSMPPMPKSKKTAGKYRLDGDDKL